MAGGQTECLMGRNQTECLMGGNQTEYLMRGIGVTGVSFRQTFCLTQTPGHANYGVVPHILHFVKTGAVLCHFGLSRPPPKWSFWGDRDTFFFSFSS